MLLIPTYDKPTASTQKERIKEIKTKEKKRKMNRESVLQATVSTLYDTKQMLIPMKGFF